MAKISEAANIGSIQLKEQASNVETPGAGFWRVFAKSDGLYVIDDAGVATGPLGVAGGASNVLGRSLTAVEVTNTATETTIMQVSIPGGTLGINTLVKARLWGDILDNTSSVAMALRVKYGTTTMYQDDKVDITNSATRRLWWIDLILHNVGGATNSQQFVGVMHYAQGINTTTGMGDLATADASFTFGGVAAEDSTGTHNLTLTVQFASASTLVAFKVYGYSVEKEPA